MFQAAAGELVAERAQEEVGVGCGHDGAMAPNLVLLHGFTNTGAWFEWGTTTAYGNVTQVQSLGSGSANTNFSQSITGLTENATYHFRAVASNSW